MSAPPRVPRGPDELAALVAQLERRFRTTTSTLTVAGHAIALLHPENAEDLIDERAFEEDERLPYWADVWPSARILCGVVTALRGRGRTFLELGCGAGLVATAAALAGFEVCATDYYDEALLFTRANVWRHAGRPPRTRLVDWRQLPRDLGRFDVVAGSDVLYEREYGALVASAVDRTLAPRGQVIIADPGRLAAADFLQQMEARGIHLAAHERLPFAEDRVRQTINVYTLRRV
ncbi:MAG TPA: methyltransferase domain-containing protein [Gemmatimonadaceae bacterium]|nr:methyltransferase domain-containing protein [Gemmatimonadaceae bacterium]